LIAERTHLGPLDTAPLAPSLGRTGLMRPSPTNSTPPENEQPLRERWAFQFMVEGDIRFVSHHDMMRTFQRALARAALPVRFSEGFNPHPKLSLPLPRPVGIASRAEAIVVEFGQPIEAHDTLTRLRGQMPGGIELLSGRRLEPGETMQPALVGYRLNLEAEQLPAVGERAAGLLVADKLEIQRLRHQDGRKLLIEVRKYIVDIHTDDTGVEFTLRVTGSGSVRPGEVLELLGIDVPTFHHRLCRQFVQWHSQKT
jgi:radical SAM-linked protein